MQQKTGNPLNSPTVHNCDEVQVLIGVQSLGLQSISFFFVCFFACFFKKSIKEALPEI